MLPSYLVAKQTVEFPLVLARAYKERGHATPIVVV